MSEKRRRPVNDYLQLESVQRAFDRAIQRAAASFAGFVRADALQYMESLVVESPLEAAFLLTWHVIGQAVRARDVASAQIYLVAQWPVEVGGRSYRLDFIVSHERRPEYEARDLSAPLIAVELDGHDFHERTKEQVASRDQRDRDLQIAGWRVFHFSGSVFHADPVGCVSQVFDYANQAYWPLIQVLDGQAD